MRRYMLPIILLLCDILSLCISIWLAIVLRFAETGANYQAYVSRMVVAMPVYLFCHLIFFFAFKLYSMVQRGYNMSVPVDLNSTFLKGGGQSG